MDGVNNGKAMGELTLASVDQVEGAKGELPQRVRDHFFKVANDRIAELKALGESETEIGGRWGVSQNTVNKIKSRTGGLGVKVLYGLRKDLRLTIDEILGLPPISRNDNDGTGTNSRSTVRPRGSTG